MTSKVYDVVADRIIEALDKGIVPWRKPWSIPAGMKPQNSQGRPYNGINSILLGMTTYQDPRWLTYKKAAEAGGQVRKGEKSMPVTFWKISEYENADGEIKKSFILRYYSVFNIAQIDGLELPPLEGLIDRPDVDPIAAAETIIANMPNKPAMAHDGGGSAFYIPLQDSIHLPPRNAFDDSGEYYSTAFHELGHATGHKSRLNRHGMETGIAKFGSAVYSREELAAEFTSAVLCHESGIENTIENSSAYIGGWISKLRNDKSLAIQAASQGQKAANYILGN